MDRFGQGNGDRLDTGEPADRGHPPRAGLQFRHLCRVLLRSIYGGVEEPAEVILEFAKIGHLLWKGGGHRSSVRSLDIPVFRAT